jgi:hypothetical protein
VLEVQVRAAQTGPFNSDLDVVGANLGFRALHQLKSRTSAGLH